LDFGQKYKTSNVTKPMTPAARQMICGVPDNGSCPTMTRAPSMPKPEKVKPAIPLTKICLGEIVMMFLLSNGKKLSHIGLERN